MVWLPYGEKNFEDIFIRFGTTHERDRRTDRQTPHADNSRAMHSIARQKPIAINGHIKTAQQRSIIHTVMGTLAVVGSTVTFGTARRVLGGLWPRPVPSSLYQM